MPRFRVSLLGLMVSLGVVALGLAALRSGSDLWLSISYTSTLALLLAAVIFARYGDHATRPFWFGFVLFGWGYLMLWDGPWTAANFRYGKGSPQDLDGRLLTSRLVPALVARVRGEADSMQGISRFTGNTVQVGQLLMTLLVALVGGLLARTIRKRQRQLPCPTQPAPIPRSSRRRRRCGLVAGAVLVALSALIASTLHRRLPVPYFPGVRFSEAWDVDAEKHSLYSSHLRAMREPPMASLAGHGNPDAIYRLLIIPRSGSSVSVRISDEAGKQRLHGVALDGVDREAPDEIALTRDRNLTAAEWRDLSEELVSARFWSESTSFDGDLGAFDYAIVLEGYRPGRHHVVDRWIGTLKLKQLYRTLLGLADLHDEEVLALLK